MLGLVSGARIPQIHRVPQCGQKEPVKQGCTLNAVSTCARLCIIDEEILKLVAAQRQQHTEPNLPPSMADTENVGATEAPNYDLLPKLIANLDRQLIYPVLQYAGDAENADHAAILEAQYRIFRQTNMTDFTIDLYKQLHPDKSVPADLASQGPKVEARGEELEAASAPVTAALDQEDVVGQLRADKVANLKFLQEEHGVTPEALEAMYAYGRYQFDCGHYTDASILLERYRILSTDAEKSASASWGKLAADILSGQWEGAIEEVKKLQESIETRLFNNPLAQLQHRTWLLHWSLFILFNVESAKDTFIDIFFQPQFINTIQSNCPWMLRYLTVAVITGRSKGRNNSQHQKYMKDLTRVIRQEGYEYHDPVTDFVRALNLDFDFEQAQQKLGEASHLLQDDFFLHSSADTFVESARHLISEAYCRIHQRIDIKDLSTRLGLNQDEGEKWIVNLIRDTRVDAKIDYKEGTVVMNHPPQSVYQQVIERTKGGFFRTQVLSAAVAK